MKRRLKHLALLLAALFVITACSTQPPGAGSTPGGSGGVTMPTPDADGFIDTSMFKKDPPYRVHFAVYSTGHPWVAALVDHMQTHLGEDPDFILTVSDGQLKKEKLISDIEDAVSKGIDLLLVNSSDADSPREAVEAAIAQGIPVMGVQKGVNSDKITAVVLADEIDIGRQQAESVVQALTERYGKPAGNVVILDGLPGASNTVERNQGYQEVFSQYPEIKIIAQQPTDFRRDKGREVMENLLQTGQHIDVAVALVDESAIGAALAIEEAGRSDEIWVWGGNAQTEALQMIKDGKMYSSIWIPDTVDQAVEVIKKLFNGEKIPFKTLVKGEMIDRTNVDEVFNPACYVFRGTVHQQHSTDPNGC